MTGLLMFSIVLFVAGLCGVYITLQRQMDAQIAELRRLVEAASTSKSGVNPIPESVPEPVHPKPVLPTPKQKIEAEAPKPIPVKEEISAEILAVIAAAVAQFVGAGARIRSTRMIPIPESSAWAQQGRVSIQASHNLAMR